MISSAILPGGHFLEISAREKRGGAAARGRQSRGMRRRQRRKNIPITPVILSGGHFLEISTEGGVALPRKGVRRMECGGNAAEKKDG